MSPGVGPPSAVVVPALCEIQERYGYLPQEELEFLSLRAQVPLYRVQEVASFFPHFRFQPPPAVVVRVCQSMTCHLRGAEKLIAGARQAFEEDIQKGKLAIEGVSCLGRCDHAPVGCVSSHGGHEQYVRLGIASRRAEAALEELGKAIDSITADDALPANMILQAEDEQKDGGTPSGWQIDVYAKGVENAPARWQAVREYVAKENPQEVIEALKVAGLVGMGGAAARTGKKWQDVREAREPTKYVVCNGDESEPGTFKDRELLLRTPHLVVEGLLIAGLTLKAAHGYIYIRHEYPEQIEAVRRSIQEAWREVPLAMARCPIEVFVSPGAYICGEESALLEAIEGRRAQPRNAPPEIRTNGLFDKPTLVNNVETLAWVPSILLRKGEWYRQAGLRFFSISGDLNRPGVYEVSIQTTLGQLINERAGGVSGGLTLQAVATSGPSGGFLPRYLKADDLRAALARNLPGLRDRGPAEANRVEAFAKRALPEGVERLDVLDLELDVALFRALELALGAGIVVYGGRPGETVDMLGHALNNLEFFHKESCGKCVPCRLGCEQLVKFTRELHRSGAAAQGLEMIEPVVRELADVMEQTSICGLGRVAANPLIAFLDHFAK
jgi:formate dehydrogenase beta subunit